MSNEAVQHINSEFLPELSMILDKFLAEFPLFDKGNEVHLSYLSKIISEYDEKNELIIDRIEDVKIEMGVTIVFFMYARQTGKPQYEQLAEQYLNRIINSLYGGDVISEENDLLFIGCGLLYLLRNNFIEGEEDEIFSEIDTTLLKRLINRDDRIETNWYAWLYYFRHRLSCEHLPDWGDSGIDFRPNAIYLFDCLKRSIQYGRKRDRNVISEVEILGLPVCRAEGVLFHLYHPRNENSRPAGFSQELINRDEFLKVCSMTKCELSDYIAGWTNVVNL